MSVVLVLGGARSGKSRFAESLAHQPAHYIATAQAFDDEMRDRIAAHKVQRGAGWVTHEEPLELVGLLQQLNLREQRDLISRFAPASPEEKRNILHPSPLEKVDRASWRETDEVPLARFILIDCLTLWLSNLLLAERDCAAEVQKLVAHLKTASTRIVIVSNEVGLGIVPDNVLARSFRDVQGIANQSVAEVATNVVFMVAGLPMALKGPLPTAQL